MLFIKSDTLEIIRDLHLEETVVPVIWHPKLNQIFIGTGSRKSGLTRILYHPDRSEKGALLCVSREPRKKSPLDFEPPIAIHTPHALPLFRESRNPKRQREKEYEQKLKAMRPQPSTDTGKELGVGKGGVLGATRGSLLTQYLLKTKVILNSN